jgi:hypothetical protein
VQQDAIPFHLVDAFHDPTRDWSNLLVLCFNLGFFPL